MVSNLMFLLPASRNPPEPTEPEHHLEKAEPAAKRPLLSFPPPISPTVPESAMEDPEEAEPAAKRPLLSFPLPVSPAVPESAMEESLPVAATSLVQ